ncbi:GAF domain-containing protein [Amycolatopsis sp. K13G38]|uniref:GAF domain-containing protein n=1 Tax=Amycolatopsis acididurans TaxID=2724524 RepID=A0ABX1IUY9_9PSEU|nr:GAF domain-containing protein [Amycolatopsis acididurans]
MHEAALSGDQPPARPRTVIEQSWGRVARHGVDPDRGGDAVPLPAEEVEQRRRASGLADVLSVLRGGLVSVADEASHIMVVVDAEGRVLWRDGSASVRRRADGLGFVEGASWDEDTVGTNAIGTALVVRQPVQVYSAEHYVRTHHAWTCAAAPVHDPKDGTLLGAIDVSGPAPSVHPSTLALVDAVARLAEAQLRTAHHAELERLRTVASPMLARIDGPVLVTDPHGWVAAVAGLPPVNRVLVPERIADGQTWLPSVGPCTAEPLPGGWLLRPVPDDGAPVTRVVLDLRERTQWTLNVSGASGQWEHKLSPRHAEILFLLASNRAGYRAPELAGGLFGDAGRTVTVRAEMSRLRRHLGGVLEHRPYRFSDRVELIVRRPADPADLLPFSTAPAVLASR